MLDRAVILVAEDQPFIALDIALAVEDAGGAVAGPASSVAETLALIGAGTVAGAILDVSLTDGDITPVVEELVERGIPMVLQSGVGLPPGLAARFPDLVVHIKPCVAASLVEQIETLISACRPTSGGAASILVCGSN